MKTNRKTHGKICFIVISVSLLLLVTALSVGMTFAKYKQTETLECTSYEITKQTLDGGISQFGHINWYTSKSGDTLRSIAEDNGVDLDRIKTMNSSLFDEYGYDEELPEGTSVQPPSEK